MPLYLLQYLPQFIQTPHTSSFNSEASSWNPIVWDSLDPVKRVVTYRNAVFTTSDGRVFNFCPATSSDPENGVCVSKIDFSFIGPDGMFYIVGKFTYKRIDQWSSVNTESHVAFSLDFDARSLTPVSAIKNHTITIFGRLCDGRLMGKWRQQFLAIPFEKMVSLPVFKAQEDLDHDQWQDYSRANFEEAERWFSTYCISPPIDFSRNCIIASCSSQDHSIDVISHSDGFFVLPRGGDKVINVIVNDESTGDNIGWSGISSMVLVPFSPEDHPSVPSPSPISSISSSVASYPSKYRVVLGTSWALIEFDLPSAATLSDIASASDTPSMTISGHVIRALNNSVVETCPLSHCVIVKTKVIAPTPNYENAISNSVSKFEGILETTMDKHVSAEECIQNVHTQPFPHIYNVLDSVFIPLPALYSVYQCCFNAAVSSSTNMSFFLSDSPSSKSYILTMPVAQMMFEEFSLPLVECYDADRVSQLTRVEQWVPEHPWAYQAHGKDSMKKFLKNTFYPGLKVGYQLIGRIFEDYVFQFGIVPKEEDKECHKKSSSPIEEEKGKSSASSKSDTSVSLEEDKECHKKSSSPIEEEKGKSSASSKSDTSVSLVRGTMGGFGFTGGIQHVPRHLRAPGFKELSFSECFQLIGAPIYHSQPSFGRQGSFFVGYQSGVVTSYPEVGHIASCSYGVCGMSIGGWYGIPVPTEEFEEQYLKCPELFSSGRSDFSNPFGSFGNSKIF
ncbi:hypothetical protein ADUPG1_013992 [Aduncisulcus paluster]|uniref:Uncharacterized protein n=1 Tax=Aduncisulcus paluster TaxID=2918883 RepID=A0ABQ5K563_9EUKA|nr:hypothetical protein ADUPG1_013992 [Aduncisulcus paluster]